MDLNNIFRSEVERIEAMNEEQLTSYIEDQERVIAEDIYPDDKAGDIMQSRLLSMAEDRLHKITKETP